MKLARPACFLILLVILVVHGGCGFETETGPEGSVDDLERLLTDEELSTPADPDALTIPQVWEDWILTNHHTIRSLTSSSFEDLAFLEDLLAGRNIVQLGENSYGVKEFNLIKVRLIRYLHEVLGFNVVAFESSLFECFMVDEYRDYFYPSEMMSYSIYRVWNTYEVVELFEYLKDTDLTEEPLRLAGLDFQISSHSGVVTRPLFLMQVIEQLDPYYSMQVHDMDAMFIVNKRLDWESFSEYVTANQDSLQRGYDNLCDFIDTHMEELAILYEDNPAHPSMARQIAWSMSRYLEAVIARIGGDADTYDAIRGDCMAGNLDYVMNDLFPSEKVVIWANNVHIRHDNTSIESGVSSMGARLHELYRPELFTIGLYMYRGRAATADGASTYEIEAPTTLGLEAVLYRIRKKFSLVDLLGQAESTGNAWMFQEVTARAWGTDEYHMVPRNQYDAILFVNSVTPPRFYWP